MSYSPWGLAAFSNQQDSPGPDIDKGATEKLVNIAQVSIKDMPLGG